MTIPLYLTKQERKKLRTKNRVERQRDLQEQIRMGLADKQDNKLKISNFMKSLVRHRCPLSEIHPGCP